MVIDRLREDDALNTTLGVGQRIYSHIPQDTDPEPTIRVSLSASEWDTKQTNGEDQIIQVDIWSDQHGDKEVLQIKDRVHVLLHARPFEGLVAQSLIIYRVGWRTTIESDSHHCVITFRHIATG